MTTSSRSPLKGRMARADTRRDNRAQPGLCTMRETDLGPAVRLRKKLKNRLGNFLGNRNFPN